MGSNTLRAGLVLIAVIAGFLLALAAGERSVRPEGLAARPWVEFQPLDEQGEPVAGAETVRIPYNDSPNYSRAIEDASPRGAFLIPFAPEDSGEDSAFFLGATPGLQEIRLNGQVIQPNLPSDTLRGATDGKALYYMIPPRLLQKDGNEIAVLVETQSAVVSLAVFHIGDASEAARAVAAGELINRYLPIMAISVLLFATLLCLVTNWPQEDRARVRTLMALMVIWALRTWFISFPTPLEVPFLITSFLYYLLASSLIIAFARHLLAGEAISRDWTRWLGWLWLAVVTYLVVITTAGFLVGSAIRYWFQGLAVAFSLMLLVLALGGLSALAWGIVARRDGRWLERLVLMACLLALSIDAADSSFELVLPFGGGLPLTFYAANPVGLLLGLGMVASIAREASAARRTVVEANAILAARLAQQDAELARSYDAQKQMLQRQGMLEERQRIVRDMHDGIGGQLLGLMMQVRQGGVQQQQIEEGLQASMADLRLIVDSMDSAEDGLAEMLRSFEHRARTQVEAAGLTFSVVHALPEGQPGPGPRRTLQILRILQEGVTNAIRHSGGSEISLTSGVEDDGSIRITIRDNGHGIPADSTRGHGIISMRSRAATLGGTLEIAGSDAGTTLALKLPAPETA